MGRKSTQQHFISLKGLTGAEIKKRLSPKNREPKNLPGRQAHHKSSAPRRSTQNVKIKKS